MDYKKISQIEERVAKNRKKLGQEKDPKKKQIKQLQIDIDTLKSKMERLKGN